MLQVIGTDGGLQPAAGSKGFMMLMPGERVYVQADSSALAGKQVTLRSLSFDAGGMGSTVHYHSCCTFHYTFGFIGQR